MNIRQLESYLSLWGEVEAGELIGLKALNFPSSSVIGRIMEQGEGVHSRASDRITPSYLPNYKIIKLQTLINNELKPEHQAVIRLKYAEFLNYDKIAKREHIHVNTVFKRMKKAKSILLALLT